MRRRIANKILNRMVWYCNSFGLWSQVPLNYGLYHRANVALKQKPYYDKEWWLYIMDNFGHTLRTQSWKKIGGEAARHTKNGMQSIFFRQRLTFPIRSRGAKYGSENSK